MILLYAGNGKRPAKASTTKEDEERKDWRRQTGLLPFPGRSFRRACGRQAACFAPLLRRQRGHLHINECCRSHAADPIYSSGQTEGWTDSGDKIASK